MDKDKALVSNDLYAFGIFQLDTCSEQLFARDESVKLAPKVYQCLVLLVKSEGRIVTKDEFFEKVWVETFVEDSSLSYTISQLRKVLAEYDAETNYIETVPRRGFRFQAEVTKISKNPEVIFERETITEEFIEEISDENGLQTIHGKDGGIILNHASNIAPNEFQSKPKLQLTGKTNSTRNRLIFISAAFLIGLFAVGFSVWKYGNDRSKTSIKDIRSIAVLPIKSFDKTQDDEQLRLRMTDSLITKFGRIKEISVRPTITMLKYVDSEIDPLEIGKILEVDAVLDGRVQQENEKVRITLQLLSIQTGEKLWSEQFDGEDNKLLDLQDAISSNLLTHLNLSLSDEQEKVLAKRPTANSEAFEEYLKGRHFWQKRSEKNVRSAITAFENAVKLDPNFAEAYIGLADSYVLLVDYSYDTSPKHIETAQNYIAKAIALNPNLSEAYTVRGLIQTTFEWNWKAAEQSLKKAIELSPNSPEAHLRYGSLLNRLRRFEEAENELRTAKKFDPTSLAVNLNLAIVMMNSKRIDEAITQFNRTLELEKDFTTPRWYLARCLWLKGDKKGTLQESAKALQIDGDQVLAEQILREMQTFDEETVVRNWAKIWAKQVSPQGINDHDLAILTAYIQDKEATLEWLEKSVEVRHPWANFINSEPEFDFIRDEPRFQAVLRKLNF